MPRQTFKDVQFQSSGRFKDTWEHVTGRVRPIIGQQVKSWRPIPVYALNHSVFTDSQVNKNGQYLLYFLKIFMTGVCAFEI